MRTLASLATVAALLVCGARLTEAHAGEDPIGSGCSITATAPATGSSASDADCSWSGGLWLAIQCDAAVYYTKNGATPTSASPKISVGDPYRLRTSSDSSSKPLKILPVSGAATCIVFKSDPQ